MSEIIMREDCQDPIANLCLQASLALRQDNSQQTELYREAKLQAISLLIFKEDITSDLRISTINELEEHDPRFFPLQALAEELGLKYRFLLQLVNQRQLPAKRCSGRWCSTLVEVIRCTSRISGEASSNTQK